MRSRGAKPESLVWNFPRGSRPSNKAQSVRQHRCEAPQIPNDKIPQEPGAIPCTVIGCLVFFRVLCLLDHCRTGTWHQERWGRALLRTLGEIHELRERGNAVIGPEAPPVEDWMRRACIRLAAEE